jgi:alpha-ketoglutarate-dependent sulfate ester dioxygenase
MSTTTEPTTTEPTTTEPTTRSTVVVTPLSGWIGAEISGVDLAQPLPANTVRAIRQALLEWRVVFFRSQELDHAGQIRFGQAFGEVTIAHPYEGDVAPEGFPEIHTISADAYARRLGKNHNRGNTDDRPNWHADITPLVNPPAASILRAEVVPPFGGDTHFTSTAAAFAGLSEPVKGLIRGLHAEHRFGHAYDASASAEPLATWLQTKPLAAIHPVVRVHPETGEEVIYVNPGFTKRIVGVTPRESRHLLDLLFEQVARTEYTVRFKWKPGSIAFWDNRATLHLAPHDYQHLGQARVLHRITLAGDIPVGPDGWRSVALDGEPFDVAPARPPEG